MKSPIQLNLVSQESDNIEERRVPYPENLNKLKQVISEKYNLEGKKIDSLYYINEKGDKILINNENEFENLPKDITNLFFNLTECIENMPLYQLIKKVEIGDISKKEEIGDIFKCCICMGTVNKPKMCPKCNTMICENCMLRAEDNNNARNRINSFSCPTCRTLSKSTQWIDMKKLDNISNYLKDVFIKKLIERQHNNCKKHPSEIISYYCNDCKIPICTECIFSEEEDIHKNHSMINFELYKKINMNLIKLNKKKDKCNEYLKKYEECIKIIEKGEEKYEKYLDEIFKELKKKLKKNSQKKITKIKETFPNVHNLIKKYDEDISKINNFLNSKNREFPEIKNLLNINTNEEENLEEINYDEFKVDENLKEVNYIKKDIIKNIQEIKNFNNIYYITNEVKIEGTKIYTEYKNEDEEFNGYINLNGLKEGKGKLKKKNGDIYEGEFKDDKFNGYGIYYYNDKDNLYKKFEGNYKNGIKKGFGKMIYKDNTEFKGEWINDNPNEHERLLMNRLERSRRLNRPEWMNDNMIFQDYENEYVDDNII